MNESRGLSSTSRVRQGRRLVVMMMLAVIGFIHEGTCDGADFATLFQRIPTSANALVAIDVDAMFASSIGKSNDWETTYRDNYASSPLIVPPASRQFLLAADFELKTMQPRWQVGSVDLKIDRSIKEIQSITSGEVDRFGEYDAVWPSSDACILKFAPHEYGLIFPADRNFVTSWTRQAIRGGAGPKSDYLRSAAAYAATQDAQLVLALDLSDAVRPQQVQLAVQNSPLLAELDEETVVRVLSSIQGLTLGIRTQDKITASMKVSFAEETSALQGVAKQLIINVLEKNGAMIPDLDDWQAQTGKRSIVLSGELSTTGMRQLFSLIALDTSIVTAGNGSGTESTESPDKRGQANIRYYRSVSRHVEDIEKAAARKSLSELTLWLETYARKIDRLPTGLVDPEMVAYGDYVSKSFRYMVDTIQYAYSEGGGTAPVMPKIKVTSVPTARTVNYGGYRMREYAPMVSAEIDLDKVQKAAQQRAQAAADAEKSAKEMLHEVKESTKEIAAQMTSRYRLNF